MASSIHHTGAVTEYKIPEPKGEDPHTAVFDSTGILWFTLQVANMVGRLDPHTGKIDLKKVQTPDSHPYGIAINSRDVPVFCEFGTNKMASINPKSMGITDYNLPQGARPRRMAIDANDAVVWYSESGIKPNTIIQFDPKTEKFARAAIPSGGRTVRNMAANSDGTRLPRLQRREQSRCGRAAALRYHPRQPR